MADARSNIAIKREIHERKEVMQEKEHVTKCGAACVTTLSLPSDINGTRGIVITLGLEV